MLSRITGLMQITHPAILTDLCQSARAHKKLYEKYIGAISKIHVNETKVSKSKEEVCISLLSTSKYVVMSSPSKMWR